MSKEEEQPSRYSYLQPLKVYRPTLDIGPMTTVRMLMADLVNEGSVRKKLRFYKLDTLLIRETRLVAQLGRTAIDKHAEALQKLAPDTWDQQITVPVKDLAAISVYNGRRIVLRLDHPAELIEERERALSITKRMTGVDFPHFPSELDINIGKLNHVLDNHRLQNRLDSVTPSHVTLLPTVIQT